MSFWNNRVIKIENNNTYHNIVNIICRNAQVDPSAFLRVSQNIFFFSSVVHAHGWDVSGSSCLCATSLTVIEKRGSQAYCIHGLCAFQSGLMALASCD